MLTVSKVNDVYLKIDCDPGTSQELSDYFTFTAGAGTNASNSGKLTIVHQYPGASFYGAKIRVRVFFGQFNGHSSTS